MRLSPTHFVTMTLGPIAWAWGYEADIIRPYLNTGQNLTRDNYSSEEVSYPHRQKMASQNIGLPICHIGIQ